ncbi:MAG: 50S ribosomal protein L19 [Candidatus Merdivicinus sp.]|jgi:large subunit ribosomal protein L19
MDALQIISQSSMKTEKPAIQIGDYVRIAVKIREGDKERNQMFEGTVIAMKHGGISETFTVRRVSYGCGVERVFPIHSPNVVSVEVLRHGRVRRAKLYYLRDRVGKAARIKEKL